MKFHFEFNIAKLPFTVKHTHKLMLMGSCFTENMGEKLRKHKFTTLENPNGILFNPVSVAEAIESYIENKQITESDIFLHNETWHSWKHHSRYSGISAEDCIEKINASTTAAHHFLQHADHLIITLGSAWLYNLTEQAPKGAKGSVVANNHKAPANWISKHLMKSEDAKSVLQTIIENLLAFNPALQIIFTISPVRHLREGAIENNRSKAALIQAVHEVTQAFESVNYFPAYELVIDDLRDYRFYAEDLVHPNYQATQYVWEKFTEVCMDEETRELLKIIAEINLAHQHKPFNPLTQQHQRFLENYFQKTKNLQEKFPWLSFEKELAYFAQIE